MAKEHAPSDMVEITNPDLPGEETGTCSYKAFKEVWEDKGFQLVEDDEPAQTPRKTTSSSKSGSKGSKDDDK